RLKLPDGRIMPIQKGQSIWEVAEKQYKKDYARLKILDIQFEDNWKKKRMNA
ncbi:MAG: hypothetical protein HY042_04540, partial [Spirochaetia bacterium]|nr:hypothetical protein [Spirochaetia bacterium]